MKMKNRVITVAVSRTIPTGDFANVKIHAGLSFTISDKEDLNRAYDKAYNEVTDKVLAYQNTIIDNT